MFPPVGVTYQICCAFNIVAHAQSIENKNIFFIHLNFFHTIAKFPDANITIISTHPYFFCKNFSIETNGLQKKNGTPTPNS